MDDPKGVNIYSHCKILHEVRKGLWVGKRFSEVLFIKAYGVDGVCVAQETEIN